MLKPVQESFENNSWDVSFATGLENNWSKLKHGNQWNSPRMALAKEQNGLQAIQNVITEQRYNKVEIHLLS